MYAIKENMKKTYEIMMDTHVHTITSVHAYNTIFECVQNAKLNGIESFVVTDHFGPYFLNGSLFQHYAAICNMRHINEKINDIRIITGVEIDIIDKEGNLAFYDSYFSFDKKKCVCEKLLEKVEVVIASCHEFEHQYNYFENTEMFINAMKNPKVNILGHCDRITQTFDINEVLSMAKKKNKIIELNCSSLEGSDLMAQRLKELAIKCAENSVMVSVGTDAHFAYKIGDFTKIKQLLNNINFPVELIVNTNYEKFFNCLSKQRKNNSS